MTDPAAPTAEQPGLRERKRRQTRRAIAYAAATLAGERGIDGATVDEISRAADISPRTFFNYFGSKEEAIAGEGPALPDETAIAAFAAARGPLFSDLAELTLQAADEQPDAELTRLRLELVRQHPQLVSVRMRTMRDFEQHLAVAVERRLAAEHPDLAADPEEAASRARLAVFAFSGVLRHAWLGWAQGDGDRVLTDDVRRSAALLAELLGSPSAP